MNAKMQEIFDEVWTRMSEKFDAIGEMQKEAQRIIQATMELNAKEQKELLEAIKAQMEV